MIIDYRIHPESLARMQAPPLGPYIDGFILRLHSLRYTHFSLTVKLRIVGHLNEWMGQRGYSLEDLDERKVEEFRGTTTRWEPRHGDAKTLKQLLHYLRDERVIPLPGPEPLGPEAPVLGAFSLYLDEERGLTECTRKSYCDRLKPFLEETCIDGDGNLNLNRLNVEVVTDYVRRKASKFRPKTSNTLISALRSFLRFLHVRGDIAISLSNSVFGVANRRHAGLPKYLAPEEVKRLLDSCDQSTHAGLRDYAVLLTLVRLGLRVSEIANLSLEDIAWQSGELHIRGRPGRTERLPLPVDVGSAIALYLRYGRPQSLARNVFVRTRAPYHAFANPWAINCILSRALDRADLHPPHQGAHLLRHTVATELLRKGATATEIGELLRHRHPDTTAIYAKVDLDSLRPLALPWPEEKADG